MNTFFTRLETRIRDIDSLLCIGLDPHPGDLPELTSRAAKTFCVSIVESTYDFAAAFKPNIAFFEALGPEGMEVLKNVIELIPNE